jgi:hypothetical protein
MVHLHLLVKELDILVLMVQEVEEVGTAEDIPHMQEVAEVLVMFIHPTPYLIIHLVVFLLLIII